MQQSRHQSAQQNSKTYLWHHIVLTSKEPSTKLCSPVVRPVPHCARHWCSTRIALARANSQLKSGRNKSSLSKSIQPKAQSQLKSGRNISSLSKSKQPAKIKFWCTTDHRCITEKFWAKNSVAFGVQEQTAS